MLSADLIFSTLILIFLFFVVGSAWNYLQSSTSLALEQQEARSIAASSLAYLLFSPGFPENWQYYSVLDGVLNLGLNGRGGVSLEKSVAFVRFASRNYSQVRDKLGLGGFDFYFSLSENVSSPDAFASGVLRPPVAYFVSDSRRFYGAINSSSLAWDLYWGGGVLEAPPAGSSRLQYFGPKVEVFDQLFQNQSAYDSIVIEGPEILLSEVNGTAVRQFLEQGGVIIYLANNSEAEIALGLPGVFFVKKAAAVEGVVGEPSALLPLVSLGQPVFSAGRWVAGGNSIHQLIVNVANGSESLVSYWTGGAGHVFFINDYDASFGGVPGAEVFNIVGRPLSAGVMPSPNASITLAESRVTFVDSFRRIPVVITLVVWRA